MEAHHRGKQQNDDEMYIKWKVNVITKRIWQRDNMSFKWNRPSSSAPSISINFSFLAYSWSSDGNKTKGIESSAATLVVSSASRQLWRMDRKLPAKYPLFSYPFFTFLSHRRPPPPLPSEAHKKDPRRPRVCNNDERNRVFSCENSQHSHWELKR